jgi:hypothetical protein
MQWIYDGQLQATLTIPFYPVGTDKIFQVRLATKDGESLLKAYLCLEDADFVGSIWARIKGMTKWYKVGYLWDSECFLGSIGDWSFVDIEIKIALPASVTSGAYRVRFVALHGDREHGPNRNFCANVPDSLPLFGDDEFKAPLWSGSLEGCPGWETGSSCALPVYGHAIARENIAPHKIVTTYLVDGVKNVKLATTDTVQNAAAVGMVVTSMGFPCRVEGAATTTSPDGRYVYQYGGQEIDENGNLIDTFYPEIWRFDTQTGEWVMLGTCGQTIIRDAMVTLLAGVLYIFGGFDGNFTFYKTLYAFNLITNTCTQLEDGPIERAAALAVINEPEIHYIGGCNINGIVTQADWYDIVAEEWHTIALPSDVPEPGEPGSPLPKESYISNLPILAFNTNPTFHWSWFCHVTPDTEGTGAYYLYWSIYPPYGPKTQDVYYEMRKYNFLTHEAELLPIPASLPELTSLWNVHYVWQRIDESSTHSIMYDGKIYYGRPYWIKTTHEDTSFDFVADGPLVVYDIASNTFSITSAPNFAAPTTGAFIHGTGGDIDKGPEFQLLGVKPFAYDGKLYYSYGGVNSAFIEEETWEPLVFLVYDIAADTWAEPQISNIVRKGTFFNSGVVGNQLYMHGGRGMIGWFPDYVNPLAVITLPGVFGVLDEAHALEGYSITNGTLDWQMSVQYPPIVIDGMMYWLGCYTNYPHWPENYGYSIFKMDPATHVFSLMLTYSYTGSSSPKWPDGPQPTGSPADIGALGGSSSEFPCTDLEVYTDQFLSYILIGGDWSIVFNPHGTGLRYNVAGKIAYIQNPDGSITIINWGSTANIAAVPNKEPVNPPAYDPVKKTWKTPAHAPATAPAGYGPGVIPFPINVNGDMQIGNRTYSQENGRWL